MLKWNTAAKLCIYMNVCVCVCVCVSLKPMHYTSNIKAVILPYKSYSLVTILDIKFRGIEVDKRQPRVDHFDVLAVMDKKKDLIILY